MYIMITVACLCTVVVSALLVAAMCRQPKASALWIVSDDAILCVVSPAMVVVFFFAILAVSWRMTHGGFAAVTPEAWTGAGIIVAASIGIWYLLRRKIRAYG